MEWFLVDDRNCQIDDGFVSHTDIRRLINNAETNAWQWVSYGSVAQNEKLIPASRLQLQYMPQHKSLNQDKGGKRSLAAWIGKSNHFRCRILAESRSKITLTRRHFSLFVHFSFDGMKWEWWTCQSEKILHLQYLSVISPLFSSILWRNYPYFVFNRQPFVRFPFSPCNSSAKQPRSMCDNTQTANVCRDKSTNLVIPSWLSCGLAWIQRWWAFAEVTTAAIKIGEEWAAIR